MLRDGVIRDRGWGNYDLTTFGKFLVARNKSKGTRPTLQVAQLTAALHEAHPALELAVHKAGVDYPGTTNTSAHLALGIVESALKHWAHNAKPYDACSMVLVPRTVLATAAGTINGLGGGTKYASVIRSLRTYTVGAQQQEEEVAA